jgi:SAM-dependent methyltransferase
MFKTKFKRIVKRILKLVLPIKFRAILRNIQTFKLIPTLRPLESRNSPRYIVSLTSYKKRLSDTAPYAIVTLFDQSIKPDKIVLWVANEDRENVPEIMEKLVAKGLEIRFCEDIRAYTKLIPALLEFPDDYIITADDDLYYPQSWFEQLLVEHKKNPRKIICHRAHGIKVDENHSPLSYNKWDFCIEPNLYFVHIFISQEQSVHKHQFEAIFPTGVGGILYPPRCFYKDITNKELFVKLSYMNDDIWYWAMAILNREYFGEENPYIVVENGYSKNLQTIAPEQQQDGNALWNYNSQGVNDKQLKAVIEHYPQIKEVLEKIEPFQSTNKEHFVPNEIKNVYENILYLIHIFAYFLDCQYIKKNNCQKILDYACGDGYGSYFVANSCKDSRVFGVDIDNDALAVAREKYNLSNLQFRHISEIDGKFDFICVHQIIEHVDNVNEFLNRLKDLLNPQGIIVISTPQREYRLNERQTPWSFGHKREYTKSEFENEVKSVFPDAQIYQMSGDKDLLYVEYQRVARNRKDRKIYGGIIPTDYQLNRTYGLDDLFLQSDTTKDSINLFAIIFSASENREVDKIMVEAPKIEKLINGKD